MGAQKIFLADRALAGPHTSKISDPKSLRGWGEMLKKFSSF